MRLGLLSVFFILNWKISDKVNVYLLDTIFIFGLKTGKNGGFRAILSQLWQKHPRQIVFPARQGGKPNLPHPTALHNIKQLKSAEILQRSVELQSPPISVITIYQANFDMIFDSKPFHSITPKSLVIGFFNYLYIVTVHLQYKD